MSAFSGDNVKVEVTALVGMATLARRTKEAYRFSGLICSFSGAMGNGSSVLSSRHPLYTIH